jgi:hypothetical protein
MATQTKSIILVTVFIVTLALCGYLAVGFAGMLFSVAFIGGFIFWLLATYRTPVNPNTIMVPYLITIVCFIIHVYEEYVSHIEVTLSTMSGTDVTQHNFLTIAAFSAPIVWLSGAIMIFKRWAFGYFLLSTFLFGMIIGELSHFVFPFIEDGRFHYSAGMYTAILPIASACWMFSRIRREMKEFRKVN